MSAKGIFRYPLAEYAKILLDLPMTVLNNINDIASPGNRPSP